MSDVRRRRVLHIISVERPVEAEEQEKQAYGVSLKPKVH
jgi:hypothetical protein